MNDKFDDEEDRSAQVRGALLKALAVVVVIGVVIALGTTVVVRALGLNEGDSPGPVGTASSEPDEPLPTGDEDYVTQWVAGKLPGEERIWMLTVDDAVRYITRGRLLLTVGDVRPLIEGRPAEQVARRFFDDRPGLIPAGAFPAAWIPGNAGPGGRVPLRVSAQGAEPAAG